jgi:hypothetical protein
MEGESLICKIICYIIGVQNAAVVILFTSSFLIRLFPYRLTFAQSQFVHALYETVWVSLVLAMISSIPVGLFLLSKKSNDYPRLKRRMMLSLEAAVFVACLALVLSTRAFSESPWPLPE